MKIFSAAQKICFILILSLLPVCNIHASEQYFNPGITINDVYACQTATIDSSDEDGLGYDLQIDGSIPVISISGNYLLENEVNNRVNAVRNEKIEYALAGSARSLSFRYEYKSFMEHSCILIYTTTSLNQLKEEVVSINFNTERGTIADIYDLLGINAISLIDSAVADEIRKFPDNYNVGFSGVKSNINFYVENNMVYLLFDKYEIAPGARGIVSIGMAVSSVKYALIPQTDYIVKTSQYDLKMLPLNKICQLIGYTFDFNGFTQVIEISNGNMSIKCAVGENRYYKHGDTPVSLESSPEIHGDVIYVPISFLESMLGIVYSVDSYENIIISYTDY